MIPASAMNELGARTLTPGAAPALLQIRVIGGAQLSFAGQDLKLRNRKACAILCYLALSEATAEPRERLTGLFWSEYAENNARQTLRQALHEIRTALAKAGCNALHDSRMAVGLHSGTYTLDLDDTLRAVAAGEVPDSLLRERRIAETIMAGLDDLDPAFYAWLLARRQRLHDYILRGLEERFADTTIPRRQQRRLAEAALLLDPTHEEACRRVMRYAAEAGETAVALRAYDELYKLLGDDHDMEPSLATQSLVAEIKQGRFDVTPPPSVAGDRSEPLISPPDEKRTYGTEMQQAMLAPTRAKAAAFAKPMPPKPALIVEPIAMHGVEPDRCHLVDGFRMELIACLTRFREWYVGTAEPAGKIAGVRLSGRYSVTATAFQAGAAINMVIVLQERPTGLAIWGEHFELRLDSWLEVQQRIVQRIAAALNVHLLTDRVARLSHVPDGSLEAYDIWLRAQAVINNYRAEEWNRVARLLAEAIEREPNCSSLYSSLAQMNNVVHFVQPGRFRDPAEAERTLALAQRAALLDPRDSRAALCLGWALAFCRRYAQAAIHMEIACELNTQDSWTLMSSAMFHAFTGDAPRASAMAERAMELALSPTVSHWVFLASIRYLAGDDEGCIAAADHAPDGLFTVAAWRAAALSNLGRSDAARLDAARFLGNTRAFWVENVPTNDTAFGRWLLHLYPLNRRELWCRLRDGLAAAGIPVAGLDFQAAAATE